MKFRVINSRYSNTENILNLYPELKDYNFTIDYPYSNVAAQRMTIEINNLKDLLKLKSEIKEDIIIEDEFNPVNDIKYILEVYDYYRE